MTDTRVDEKCMPEAFCEIKPMLDKIGELAVQMGGSLRADEQHPHVGAIRAWLDQIAALLRPTEPPDEPAVMGAGCGLWPPTMPTQADAEAAWRTVYVDRMVERGIAVEDARAAATAIDAVLSEDPAAAADADLEYWNSDGETP